MSKKVFPGFSATLGAIALVTVLALSSCSTPEDYPMTPDFTFKAFSGNGTADTEEFVIIGQDMVEPSKDWGITWEFNPYKPESGEYGNFLEIDLIQPGGGSPVNIVPRVNNISDKLYEVVFMDEPGKYRFAVRSSGGNWIIRVFDFGRP